MNKTQLILTGKFTKWYVWALLGFISVVTLFILKGLQGYLENTTESLWGYSCTNRIHNISFWFVVFGFFCMVTIANLIPTWNKIGLWKHGIEITADWLLFALALSFCEIGLYLSAVYRDGGTFFIQVDWGHDHTTHPGVYAIQVVEGILNCILLSMISLWAAIAHAAITKLKESTSEEQIKVIAESGSEIAWATLFPVCIFLGLADLPLLPVEVDWRKGISNVWLASLTAFLMWSVFFWLFARLVFDHRLKLQIQREPPFLKLAKRD